MAIECVHIYPYSADQTFSEGLDLPLRDYSKSQLAITNIEGVAPVSANVNITQYAARDGGIFNSSKIAERHITITMKLFSSPSMDAVRQKVFSAAPIGQAITLIFDWSDGVSKAIDGYVEDTPADYFGDQEGIQIAVACPDPNFRVVQRQETPIEEKPVYKTVINYKQCAYPEKRMIVDEGSDLWYLWQQPVKDETERYTIDTMFFITNRTKIRQKYLFAVAFLDGWKELIVNFYSSKFGFIRKSVNEYVGGLTEAVWEEGKYFIESDEGYEEVETELHFNYLTQAYSALTAAATWEPNKYYEKSDAPETGKWMSVTWPAQYDDEEDPEAFPYKVTYGFLIDNKVSGEIVNSIVNVFDAEASYFTPAAKAFSVLSKSGTNLPSATTFVENQFYRLGRVYNKIGDLNGWCKVQAPYDLQDPTHDGEYAYWDENIYFLEDYPDVYKNEGHFIDTPVYGFYYTVKTYIVYNTPYRANTYYYMNTQTGVEVLLTGGSAPSDWASSVPSNKYYSKTQTFYEMKNFVDSTKLYGRYIYDIMLDYMTYKYVPITEPIAYESGKYYSYVGMATSQLRGLYDFTEIPIYQVVEGEVPSDWGTSGSYFERVRMIASEVENERGGSLYFNDRVYRNIRNRNVTEYIPLQTAPADWTTNYNHYFTVDTDYTWIIAYFTPDEYPDYTKIYNLLTSDPGDMDTNYANYYICTKNYDMLLEKNGTQNAKVIPPDSDNILTSVLSLVKTNDEETNFLLGDVNGNIETYVYKKSTDQYYAGGYYVYDSLTQSYVKLTSNVMPEDFYSAPYKYFKKEVVKCDFIPAMTIIFYNPVTNRLEYDVDQYSMFINDFKSWVDHAMSPVISYQSSSTGNRKIIRKDNFISYTVSGVRTLNGTPILDLDDNFILIKTKASDGTLVYDQNKVVGIAASIS